MKKMRHKKVVVGSSTAAVSFARKKKIPIVIPNDEYPFRFDTFDETPELEMWSKDLWALGLDGLNPFYDSVNQVTVDEDKIRVVHNNTSVTDIEYDQCFLFETENGVNHTLDLLNKSEKLYRVVDWFSVDRCEPHNQDRIKTGDDFINDIIFYISDRIDGNKTFKDIAAVSYLREDQLTKFDYSDTMAVFKTRYHLTEGGVKGRVSYYDKKGIAHRYKVRMRPTLREKELISKNMYRSTDKIHFCSNITLRDIFDGKTP